VVGLSRKSFIGRVLGGEEAPLPPAERLEGSLAANLWAAAQGAHILRVHDVKETVRALALWKNICNADRMESPR
jgi:dihydropteroate synthase